MKSIFGIGSRDNRKEPLIESLRSADSTVAPTSNARPLSMFTRQRSSQPPPPAFSAVPSVDDVSVREPPVLRRQTKFQSTIESAVPAAIEASSPPPKPQQNQEYSPPKQPENDDAAVPATSSLTQTSSQQSRASGPSEAAIASANAAQMQPETLAQARTATSKEMAILHGDASRSRDSEAHRASSDPAPVPTTEVPNTNATPFLCYPMRAAPLPKDASSDEDRDEIPTKIPALPSWYSKLVASSFVRSGVIYVVIVAITAAAMVYGVSAKLLSADWRSSHSNNNVVTNSDVQDLQVAFVGNAYFFVNDVPRLLEAVSEGHVYQNSCLHAGGSLADILVTGNGMYTLWQTEDAVFAYSVEDATATCLSSDTTTAYTAEYSYSSYYAYDEDEVSYTCATYDFGLCTVAQILQGYDEYMAYGNKYGKYYSDGSNPCIMDTSYASFVEAELQEDPVTWDYVVFVEQTKRMAVPEALADTLSVLTYRYGPMLATSGAVPVVVDTHAFWSNKSNMTGLTDIPTFTYLITLGVAEFVDALASVLPSSQAPLVAPIGLAYLVVWEEDYELWQTLFLDDGIHSSLSGSYMFACVLYATLFGRLPDSLEDESGGSGSSIASLFLDARPRKIVGTATYPSSDEVAYLRDVAGRVTLEGYVPSSLLDVEASYNSGSRRTRNRSRRHRRAQQERRNRSRRH